MKQNLNIKLILKSFISFSTIGLHYIMIELHQKHLQLFNIYFIFLLWVNSDRDLPIFLSRTELMKTLWNDLLTHRIYSHFPGGRCTFIPVSALVQVFVSRMLYFQADLCYILLGLFNEFFRNVWRKAWNSKQSADHMTSTHYLLELKVNIAHLKCMPHFSDFIKESINLEQIFSLSTSAHLPHKISGEIH